MLAIHSVFSGGRWAGVFKCHNVCFSLLWYKSVGIGCFYITSGSQVVIKKMVFIMKWLWLLNSFYWIITFFFDFKKNNKWSLNCSNTVLFIKGFFSFVLIQKKQKIKPQYFYTKNHRTNFPIANPAACVSHSTPGSLPAAGAEILTVIF